MFSNKLTILKLWSKVFFITLLLVYIIQLFIVQSYTISSSQMNNALYSGDRILVDKLSYGLRLPITPVAIPFCEDKFLGIKSYFNTPAFDYRRLSAKPVERNDIVLFNNPTQLKKPLDRRSLILSRCVGLSGDTISFNSNRLIVNNVSYISSPDVRYRYKLSLEFKENLLSSAENRRIAINDLKFDSIFVYISLSKYESFLLNQDLDDSLSLVLDESNDLQMLVIPFAGMTIKLTPDNLAYYAFAIMDENPSIRVQGNYLVEGSNVLKEYTFSYNYYWFSSDNIDYATDSRSLGIVSQRSIIGKAFLTWYHASK